MSSNIPKTQYALELTGPDQMNLNSEKQVHCPGPYQILARIEAVGLCFSDLKLLKQFDRHPRKSGVVSGIDKDVLSEIPCYKPGLMPTVAAEIENVIWNAQAEQELMRAAKDRER